MSDNNNSGKSTIEKLRDNVVLFEDIKGQFKLTTDANEKSKYLEILENLNKERFDLIFSPDTKKETKSSFKNDNDATSKNSVEQEEISENSKNILEKIEAIRSRIDNVFSVEKKTEYNKPL